MVLEERLDVRGGRLDGRGNNVAALVLDGGELVLGRTVDVLVEESPREGVLVKGVLVFGEVDVAHRGLELGELRDGEEVLGAVERDDEVGDADVDVDFLLDCDVGVGGNLDVEEELVGRTGLEDELFDHEFCAAKGDNIASDVFGSGDEGESELASALNLFDFSRSADEVLGLYLETELVAAVDNLVVALDGDEEGLGAGGGELDLFCSLDTEEVSEGDGQGDGGLLDEVDVAEDELRFSLCAGDDLLDDGLEGGVGRGDGLELPYEVVRQTVAGDVGTGDVDDDVIADGRGVGEFVEEDARRETLGGQLERSASEGLEELGRLVDFAAVVEVEQRPGVVAHGDDVVLADGGARAEVDGEVVGRDEAGGVLAHLLEHVVDDELLAQLVGVVEEQVGQRQGLAELNEDVLQVSGEGGGRHSDEAGAARGRAELFAGNSVVLDGTDALEREGSHSVGGAGQTTKLVAGGALRSAGESLAVLTAFIGVHGWASAGWSG